MPLPGQIAPIADDWQSQLRNVITSRRELLDILGLGDGEPALASSIESGFPLKVPHSFVRRMQPGNPRDPLLLQVLSTPQEADVIPGYVRDPVGESGTTIPQRGIIHKYHGRVLLLVTSGCAVNCRYCFRRHFPYNENQNSRQQWREALQYIRADTSIEEVILSGGDPLVATDAYLQQLVLEIVAIRHVRRLRIHTRLPVVIPERVTDSLLDIVTHKHLQTIVVIHCNHANEIDDSVIAAMARMRHRDITVLNQAVLLAGVNDSLEAQVALCQRLFAAGVMPYYLHLLDKVQGAAHFDVAEHTARQILAGLMVSLPGYLVPKLVREIAGAESKTPC